MFCFGKFLSPSSLIHSSVMSSLLISPSNVFFICVIIFFPQHFLLILSQSSYLSAYITHLFLPVSTFPLRTFNILIMRACQSLSHVRLFVTLWTQPTRLLCPWNSPGKDSGVGIHSLLWGIFPTQGPNLGLLHCRQLLYHLSHQVSPILIIYSAHITYLVVSNSLWPHGLQPTRLLCPWNFPSRNTGVECHFILQGIFLTQGLKPYLFHLHHWQVDSLLLVWSGEPNSCSTWTQLLCGMWDLPEPGIKPVSPALVSGFLTTEPPEKPQIPCLIIQISMLYIDLVLMIAFFFRLVFFFFFFLFVCFIGLQDLGKISLQCED